MKDNDLPNKINFGIYKLICICGNQETASAVTGLRQDRISRYLHCSARMTAKEAAKIIMACDNKITLDDLVKEMFVNDISI